MTLDGIVVVVAICVAVYILRIAFKMEYNTNMIRNQLFIVTDKRSIKDGVEDTAMYLIEVNKEFFVNVNSNSYENTQIGDKVILANNKSKSDFVIKKI